MNIEVIKTNWELPYIHWYSNGESDYDRQVVIQTFRHRIFIVSNN